MSAFEEEWFEIRPLPASTTRVRGGGVSGKSPLQHLRNSSLPALPDAAAELSRHLLRAQEQERKRISRELHDDTGQGLMVLRFHLAMLMDAEDEEQLRSRVQETLSVLDRTIEGLRRTIGRLSPRPLEDLGLIGAIRKEARDVGRQTGMKSEVTLPEQIKNIDQETEVAIYRSVQEALHNIAKHSQAGNFKIQIENQNGSVRLSIEDDGVGFSNKKSSSPGRFGLDGLKERALALGGSAQIRSRKGAGTSIAITLPAGNRGTRRKRTELARQAAAVG